MALAPMSPPGQKQAKASTLENAANVMGIVGSLGKMYSQFSKPVSIDSFDTDKLMSELAKRRIAEGQNQAKSLGSLNQDRKILGEVPWERSGLQTVTRKGP